MSHRRDDTAPSAVTHRGTRTSTGVPRPALRAVRPWVIVALGGYVAAVSWVTLFPVPHVDAGFCAARPLGSGVQLDPLRFVADATRAWNRHDGDPLAWLGSVLVQQNLQNVLLFVPLGLLLRGALNRSVTSATRWGAAFSILVELTQLTGNWFTVPCAYRVADVDDVLMNTVGTLLGALLASALLTVRQPSRQST